MDKFFPRMFWGRYGLTIQFKKQIVYVRDISNLLDTYYVWLKDQTAWRQINTWVEITTPYLDRNNDYIQIYLKKTNDGFFLTDSGYTIAGLLEEGCALDSPKRQKLLKTTLNRYDVTEEDGNLQVKGTTDNFALKKHFLIQAILSINDMFYLTAPTKPAPKILK